MVDAEGSHPQAKFEAAYALKLLRVQLDREAMRTRAREDDLSIFCIPCVMFDKDIDGCGEAPSGRLRDELVTDAVTIGLPFDIIFRAEMNEQSGKQARLRLRLQIMD
jgi:hypothetical protein